MDSNLQLFLPCPVLEIKVLLAVLGVWKAPQTHP